MIGSVEHPSQWGMWMGQDPHERAWGTGRSYKPSRVDKRPDLPRKNGKQSRKSAGRR